MLFEIKETSGRRRPRGLASAEGTGRCWLSWEATLDGGFTSAFFHRPFSLLSSEPQHPLECFPHPHHYSQD